MALYLGDDRVKINLNSIIYHLNLITTSSVTNYIGLLSSDNCILTDSSGIHLIPSDFPSSMMLSANEEIIVDSDGVYLTY